METEIEAGVLDSFTELIESAKKEDAPEIGSLIKRHLKSYLNRSFHRKGKQNNLPNLWHRFLIELDTLFPGEIPKHLTVAKKGETEKDVIDRIENNLLRKWVPKETRLRKLALISYLYTHTILESELGNPAPEIDREYLGAPFREVFGTDMPKTVSAALELLDVFRLQNSNSETLQSKYKKSKLLATYAKQNILKESYQAARDEFSKAKNSILHSKNSSATTTAAVYGAGGYGKSSLAQEICDDPDIMDRFSGGIYWLQFGLVDSENEDAGHIDLRSAIFRMLEEQYSRQVMPELNLIGRDDDIEELLKYLPEGPLLLIADDVWTASQASWITHLSECEANRSNVSILVTTRVESVASLAIDEIPIKRLLDNASYKLLTHGMKTISSEQERKLRRIARGFKGWPLLLNLANGVFRQSSHTGQDAIDRCIEEYEEFISSDEIDGWDQNEVDGDELVKRRTLVGKCIEASLKAIHSDMHPELVRSLGAFPEDTDIPFSIVVDYWMHLSSIKLGPLKAKKRLKHFKNFSLYSKYSEGDGTFRLHDEVLAYFRRYHTDRNTLEYLHSNLVSSFKKHCNGLWNELDSKHIYIWKNLLHHLELAGRIDEANDLRTDFDWISTFIRHNLFPVYVPFSSKNLSEDAELVKDALFVSRDALSQNPDSIAHQIFGRLGARKTGRTNQLVKKAVDAEAFYPRPSRPHLKPNLSDSNSKISKVSLNVSACKVMVARQNGVGLIWDIATEKVVGETKESFPPNLIFFDDTGEQALIATLDSKSTIWDFNSNTRSSATMDHNGWVVHANFSKNSDQLLTSTDSGVLSIWDTNTVKEIGPQLNHGKWIQTSLFKDNGKMIYLGTNNGEVLSWAVSTGDLLTLPILQPGRIEALHLNSTETLLLSQCSGGVLCFRDIANFELVGGIRNFTTKKKTKTVKLKNDKLLAFSAYSVSVWCQNSGDKISEIVPSSGYFTNAIFNHSASQVATSTNIGRLMVWDTVTGQQIGNELFLGTYVVDMCFVASDKYLAVTNQKMELLVFDMKNQHHKSTIQFDYDISIADVFENSLLIKSEFDFHIIEF